MNVEPKRILPEELIDLLGGRPEERLGQPDFYLVSHALFDRNLFEPSDRVIFPGGFFISKNSTTYYLLPPSAEAEKVHKAIASSHALCYFALWKLPPFCKAPGAVLVALTCTIHCVRQKNLDPKTLL